MRPQAVFADPPKIVPAARLKVDWISPAFASIALNSAKVRAHPDLSFGTRDLGPNRRGGDSFAPHLSRRLRDQTQLGFFLGNGQHIAFQS
jgi:hypothetical protein